MQFAVLFLGLDCLNSLCVTGGHPSWSLLCFCRQKTSCCWSWTCPAGPPEITRGPPLPPKSRPRWMRLCRMKMRYRWTHHPLKALQIRNPRPGEWLLVTYVWTEHVWTRTNEGRVWQKCLFIMEVSGGARVNLGLSESTTQALSLSLNDQGFNLVLN